MAIEPFLHTRGAATAFSMIRIPDRDRVHHAQMSHWKRAVTLDC